MNIKNLYFKSFFDNTKTILLAITCAVLLYISTQNDALQEICLGIAIFLFGMIFLEDGFKGFSGGIIEKILTRWTSSRLKAISFGVISTILMQSSTLVTIISISFLSAGLISLAQAIGIVFGANLGTTTGGFIIAGIGMKMNIAAIGTPLIIISIVLIFQKDKNIKSLGHILSGIGFFFLGIAYIKSGFQAYSSVLDLSQYSQGGVRDLAIFILAGILITSIVQSSFATLTIVISALASASISYDNALALVIGTNVGGVVTALIASFSANIEGKKLAITNTLFNIIIAVVCVALLEYFKIAVDFISDIFGVTSTDYALKIAIFHTFYNALAVFIMSPYINTFVTIANKYIKSNKNGDMDAPIYINDNIISYPNTALEALQNEQKHLYQNAFSMYTHTLGFHTSDIKSDASIESLLSKKWYKYDVDINEKYKNKIKVLFDSMLEFGVHVQAKNTDPLIAQEIESISANSRYVLEATKNLILASENIKKFSNSKNKHIAKYYSDLRLNLAEILRCGVMLTKSDDEKTKSKVAKILKSKREYFRTLDSKAINSVEALIKDNQINISSGTSLINDIGFLHNVAKYMIRAMSKTYNLNLKNDELDEKIPSKKPRIKKPQKAKEKK